MGIVWLCQIGYFENLLINIRNRHRYSFGVFAVETESISHVALVLLFEQVNADFMWKVSL